jgi:hypothetical protein
LKSRHKLNCTTDNEIIIRSNSLVHHNDNRIRMNDL